MLTLQVTSVTSSSGPWLCILCIEDGQCCVQVQSVSSMISDCLNELLPPVERQLLEWTVALRLHAARTALAIVQVAGKPLFDHLVRLLPALRHARGAAADCQSTGVLCTTHPQPFHTHRVDLPCKVKYPVSWLSNILLSACPCSCARGRKPRRRVWVQAMMLGRCARARPGPCRQWGQLRPRTCGCPSAWSPCRAPPAQRLTHLWLWLPSQTFSLEQASRAPALTCL